VGKSTASAALAAWLARERGGPVLLLSTDPAGSLGDVLGQPVGAEPAVVEGRPGLLVQQVDAGAAWERFHSRYREDTERLFASLTADADREVVRRLVDLSPPGLDELMAVMEVTDALEAGAYGALVVDTAPTGHLLRLLGMPDLALDWAHALLRLLLKYRSVVGLGDLAERVLQLTHSLRGLRGRLQDPAVTWLLAVALPEGLSVPETARLLAGLRERGVPVGALLVNRLLSAGAMRPEAAREASALLKVARGLPCAAAPEGERGPVGVEALEAFAGEWRTLAPPDAARDSNAGGR
jgi:arsenite-transporting ATPase